MSTPSLWKWSKLSMVMVAVWLANGEAALAQSSAAPEATTAHASVAHPMPMGHHSGHGWFSGSGSGYRSPGLAAALSLTPVPVDFGNLYAENLGWGIAYTSVELSLATAMMLVGGSHMGMGHGDGNAWSDRDRNVVIGLVAGYVVTKLAAAVHASYAARDFNEARSKGYVSASTIRGGAQLVLGQRF